ncbi:MAG TPA: DUF1289 domain-containing protein [Polaromonas sp.]
MSTMNLIACRARLARVEGQNVPSPCVSVCCMSAASGLCEGCFRTLDEIRAWSSLADEDKRRVWGLVEQRAGRVPA